MKNILLGALFIIALCLVIGTTLTQAKSSPIEEQPIATPESYFDESYIEPPYNPCKDPHLPFYRSEEYEQLRKQCEVKQ